MKNLVLIFCCLVFLVSGCAKKDEKITIQFASRGSKTEVDIIKSVIDDFETRNPTIDVDFLHIPQNYFQKIHLLFASNTEPDVIFVNNHYLPVYVNADKLLPLSVNRQFYDEKVLDVLSRDENLYALPRDISLLVVYYNKDLFRRLGLNCPQQGWTIEEFLQTTQEIARKSDVFGVSFEEEPLFYLPYVMSEGGSFFDLNSEQSQKALNFYADLRKKYHVAPRREESASATMAQMFLQEKIAMHLSGRWLTPKYTQDATFEWDIVPFPIGSNGSVVPLDASGWAIAKSTKHKDEALLFVNYLASQEVISKFAQTGLIVPARNDVDFQGEKVYREILKTACPTPVSVDYNILLDDLKRHLEPLFN